MKYSSHVSIRCVWALKKPLAHLPREVSISKDRVLRGFDAPHFYNRTKLLSLFPELVVAR